MDVNSVDATFIVLLASSVGFGSLAVVATERAREHARRDTLPVWVGPTRRRRQAE